MVVSQKDVVFPLASSKWKISLGKDEFLGGIISAAK
jgi:hypothetical protein